MTFVQNAWYMFGWERELAEGPVSRMILGEPVVVFRDGEGELSALRDVCPHRAVPLSMGRVKDGHLQCPYHGLEFDRDGICRHNPHVAGPPDRIRVRSFPIVRRYDALWLWMGDPAQANMSDMVDLAWFDPEQYSVCTGSLHINANYRLLIDNLMDLAHAEFIHPTTVGTPGSSGANSVELKDADGVVTVSTFLPDMPATGLFEKIWTRSANIDKYSDMSWHFPSVMALDLGVMTPGASRSEGFHTPSVHILTPETETSTHYFWSFSRNFALDDEAVSAAIATTVSKAFNEEDKPVLEAAQKRLSQTGAKLLDFTIGDSGSAKVRRRLDRAVAAEAGA